LAGVDGLGSTVFAAGVLALKFRFDTAGLLAGVDKGSTVDFEVEIAGLLKGVSGLSDSAGVGAGDCDLCKDATMREAADPGNARGFGFVIGAV
jgi:hypothetical protein